MYVVSKGFNHEFTLPENWLIKFVDHEQVTDADDIAIAGIFTLI